MTTDIKFLIVWNENPEEIKFYLLDPKSEQAEWARQSNGKMINGDDIGPGDPLDKLNEWLGATQTPVPTPIKGRISEVVTCGFFM